MEWIYVILSALTLGLALYWRSRTSRQKNPPPGPRGIPFLGNLLSFGKQPHITMLKWKEQYGDIYRVYDGRRPMVVLSDFNTVRKVFGGDAVTDRFKSNIRVDIGIGEDTGLVLSQGDLWKTHRRFALQTLRDLGMGKNWLEDTIIVEVEALCQTLRETKQKAFNPKLMMNNSVANVICALIFGHRYELTDPKLSSLTGLVTQNVQILALDSLTHALPFLLWFPNFFRRNMLIARQNGQNLMAFLREKVAEHEVVDRQADVQDYVHAYQTAAESKDGPKDKFDEEQLLASLGDLFGAGTETTSTTMLWSFVFMIENPDVMKKVQEEIDNNLGREKPITYGDRALLPYTEAVIMEVHRSASLTPMGIPHVCREDTIIDGYTIPKGTMVAANFFSIHRDPRWWKNPLKFDPTRFLDENGKLTRPDGFAPFSIGKRACLGEALAKMELFLFFANVMRCFTLELPPGKTLTRDDYFSSIAIFPLPYELIFIPRVL